MMTSLFDEGQIVRYEYLWNWQAKAGRTNGEKPRPCCLALSMKNPRQNLTHMILLPISGTPPRPEQEAIVIPTLELKRAGLSTFKEGWITVSEYNYDILERSFVFDPNQTPMGKFSNSFTRQILQRLRPYIAASLGRVDRAK